MVVTLTDSVPLLRETDIGPAILRWVPKPSTLTKIEAHNIYSTSLCSQSVLTWDVQKQHAITVRNVQVVVLVMARVNG